ncbi:unnamed protein product [Mycena citricolor]|uniref:MFS general substrate transporter n=1 Tax=Mycena citricolor TaxID=2018698 RepID=A0AAD2JUQ5_9AGAR|nr:unnamed protein product [Mycena citricolor]
MASSPDALDRDREERALTRKILWKLDCHVLPPLALLWLCNFIDRSNVGNARIAGLEKSTGLHGNQFNIVLTGEKRGSPSPPEAMHSLARCSLLPDVNIPAHSRRFFNSLRSYLASEIPSNLILKRMKATYSRLPLRSAPDVHLLQRWLPLIVFLWGAVTIMTCFVHNFGGLIAIRLALGMCEGAWLLPGMCRDILRVGFAFRAFGGLLATGILSMDGLGGLAGWKWIFVIEGLATVVVSIIAAYFMPEGIATASFLTPEERRFALNRFHGVVYEAPVETSEKGETSITENAGPSDAPVVHLTDEKFEWREVVRGLTDFQTWVTGIAYLGLIVSLYSFSLFLPTIVAGLNYTGKSAQLHTVPPYVPATVLTVLVAFLSDRLKWRGPFILICLPFAITGYILAIAAKTNAQRYGAVFLIAAGVYPSGPAILSILPNNSSGYYKRATTTALQLAIGNAGGFIATNIYTTDQAPKYIKGHSIVLGFLILAWFMIAVHVYVVTHLLSSALDRLLTPQQTARLPGEQARAQGRRHGNITAYNALRDAGLTSAPIGDRDPAFRFTP